MTLIDRYLILRFTAAEPEKVLTKLAESKIELTSVSWIDTLTVQIRIKRSFNAQAQSVLEKHGASYRIIRHEGMLWYALNICKRPVLLLGFLMFLSMALVIPGRILFFEFVGNTSISDSQLMQQLEDCGVCFGTNVKDLRSEKIKNVLLERIPKLQWVGITSRGCVATIHVRERSTAQGTDQTVNSVSSIVASHDGIISQMTVYRGNPLVNVGQSVKAGDVIISGYTDCGLKTVAQQAEGEVFAYTHRQCNAVAPVNSSKRGDVVGERDFYRLSIGKKVINLYNHSGISDATCVKMYSEYYWPLSGKFFLPISLTRIRCIFYNDSDKSETADAMTWLPQFTKDYLLSHMIAGSILDASVDCNVSKDCHELIGRYACHEMIAQVKREEIIN